MTDFDIGGRIRHVESGLDTNSYTRYGTTTSTFFPPTLKSRVFRITSVSPCCTATAACNASGNFLCSLRRREAARSAISLVIGRCGNTSSSSRANDSVRRVKPARISARVMTEMAHSLPCSARKVVAASTLLKWSSRMTESSRYLTRDRPTRHVDAPDGAGHRRAPRCRQYDAAQLADRSAPGFRGG